MEKGLAPHPKSAKRLVSRVSGGVLTFLLYFLLTLKITKPRQHKFRTQHKEGNWRILDLKGTLNDNDFLVGALYKDGELR